MLRVIPVAVLLWIVSAFWVLVTFDSSEPVPVGPNRLIRGVEHGHVHFSLDGSVFAWAALVIFVLGIVAGLLGAIFVTVSAIVSGHREKKQWA
jgi:H+/Cl- antiporter ClcA